MADKAFPWRLRSGAGGRFNEVDLAGKTALLTGATGGLGRAIAAALAERGVTLVLSSRQGDELERLAAELPGSGHRFIVSDLAEVGAAAELAAAAGDVDIVVANAGLHGTGRLPELSEAEIERTLRVNVEAPIILAKTLIPAMQERGEGHVVFIASLAGKAASPRSSIYNATKFGLRGFALGLMADLKGGSVGASLVSPGFIRDAGMFAVTGAKTPPGIGTGTPEQVGKAVVNAIEKKKIEVTVAPLPLRMLAHLGLALPSLSLLLQSGKAGQRAAEKVASGHKQRESKEKAGT